MKACICPAMLHGRSPVVVTAGRSKGAPDESVYLSCNASWEISSCGDCGAI